MVATYPVAYRAAAREAGRGFQQPRPIELPLPGNDNFPFPANDNPINPRPRPTRFPTRKLRRTARRAFKRWVFDHPLFRLLDLVDYWYDAMHRERIVHTSQTFGNYTYLGQCLQDGRYNGPPVWQYIVGKAVAPACLGGQAGSGPLFGSQPTSVNGDNGIHGRVLQNSLPRYMTTDKWLRINYPGGWLPALADYHPHAFRPYAERGPEPGFDRTVDPLETPIQSPVVDPVPIPYPLIPGRQPNPWRSPTEQTQRGYDLAPRASDYPLPGPNVRPGQAVKRPPGKKEKESKLLLGPHPASVIGRAISAVSEFGDFIDSLHKALPRKYRSKRRGRYWEGQAVYRHLDKVDWAKAIKNLIENEAEDRFFGSIGRLNAKANRARNATGGTALGPAL